MKIKQKELEEILKNYVPGARYLRSAEFDYPEIIGKFCVPGHFYYNTRGDAAHFTAVELIICLNQLGYIFFNEVFKQGLIKEMSSISMEEFRDLQKSAFLITYHDSRFSKPIDIREDFEGKLIKNRTIYRKKNSLCFVNFDYDFDKGKAIGKLNTALLFDQQAIKYNNQ